MGRLNLSNVTENVTAEESNALDTLIPSYANNKAEMDSYKKVCETQNSQIKEQMEKLKKSEYTAGGYVAKRIVVEKESMNEERLLDILAKHGIPEVIKTKEYVDMDALEKYLYNNELSDELAADLNSCRIINTTVQLRISKEKKKKENK